MAGSYEESVRATHAFEDTARLLLDLASALTDQELELALAKLADRVGDTTDEEADDAQVRGLLLTGYYQLRRAGTLRHKPAKRALQRARMGGMSRHAFSEQLVVEIESFPIAPPPRSLGDQPWRDDQLLERVRSLAP